MGLKRWTKEETEYLFAHWDGEHTAKSIAEYLKVHPDQVIAKAKYHKLGGKRGLPRQWTGEQLDYLSELAESLLLEELIKKYNYKARLSRWPKRTRSAIQQKLNELGYQSTPVVGYLTEGLVCALLNRSNEWLRSVIKLGKLAVKPQGKGKYVSEEDFLKFCVNHRSEVAERMGSEGIEYLLSLLVKY